MRCIKLIICCVSIILVTSITSSARGWRGIIPLHSTRQDVERLLGTPREIYYDLKNETVYIDFSSGTCQNAGPDSYKVQANTVTRIMVIPKSEPLLESLGLDISRYKESVDGHIQEHVFYYNEEMGESIETFENRIESITYAPAASEASLRCYASVDDWMTANNIACVLPATKFDEFGTLSRGEEHRRLKNIAIQLKLDPPTSRAWIMVYGDKKGGIAAVFRQAKRIKHLLVFRHGLPSRRVLTTGLGTLDGPRVEVWISQVGQRLPGFSHPNAERDE